MEQIDDLSVDDFSCAIDSMVNIEAQETLNLNLISMWPNLKQADREKMHEKLYRQAYPDTFKERKEVSLVDVLRGFSGR